MQAGWEQQDLGRLALLGSTGAVLCGSRVKAGSVNSNHKEQGLSKLQGALGTSGESQEAGETVYQQGVGEGTSGT